MIRVIYFLFSVVPQLVHRVSSWSRAILVVVEGRRVVAGGSEVQRRASQPPTDSKAEGGISLVILRFLAGGASLSPDLATRPPALSILRIHCLGIRATLLPSSISHSQSDIVRTRRREGITFIWTRSSISCTITKFPKVGANRCAWICG